MDKKIEKKSWSLKKKIALSGTLFLLVMTTFAFFSSGKSKLNIDSSSVTVYEVSEGNFEEFIPIDGVVFPIKTIFLDAVEGGRVEEKLAEEGVFVKKGEPLLRLSNNNLHLDFMNRETLLLDQLNNMRNTRISLDQNVLQMRQQLLEIEFAYQEKKRNYERNKTLFEQNVIPKAEFEKIEDDYKYTASKRMLLIETFKKDSVLKRMQIAQIESSSALIEKNLAMLKESLDNLLIKAPISGQLTSLNVEVGETKQKGENIGQIDVLEGFKIRANVDEHYISRITTGLLAEFLFDNKTHQIEVKKIFPKVTNGQFQVDLEFKNEIPKGLKQGQTLQVKLSLSSTTKALLLKRGGFYQKSGGNWVYLVSGNKAIKKQIKLGRQNPDFYEVKEGLNRGDKVIVSTYDVFGEADELIFNENK